MEQGEKVVEDARVLQNGHPGVGADEEVHPHGNHDDGEEHLSAALALSINAGAYIAETIRADIQSVDVGQGEAASALGLSAWQSMRYVILPQALKSVVPALGNSFVSLIKDSSLASVIATPELMYWANAANAQYYRVWETFITTAVIYLFLTVVTSRILAKLEKNM